ncbi:MAG TPA: hypothetical protein VFO01_06210 [Trebonia sp.]|nr:hypothetical protein [Trebonia sp.]
MLVPCLCSRSAAPTSSPSPATWKPGAGPRATVTRRLCTIAGFYKYAVEEELLEHSPAAHVRRPRVDYESHAIALDRNELGALLVAAGLGPPPEHALISLLALNGLRVSEATGADIEHLGLERGHRTLTITRKGGKVVTIPLAPRTARAIDLAIGERADVPVFLAADGRRLDRHGADGSSARPPAAPGSARPSHLTRCAMRSSPPRGCRGPAARRAGGRLARRPADRDAVRPGPWQPGPARYLYCRRLRRGRRAVTGIGSNNSVRRSRPPDRTPLPTIRPVLVGDAPRSQDTREPPLWVDSVSSWSSALAAPNGAILHPV